VRLRIGRAATFGFKQLIEVLFESSRNSPQRFEGGGKIFVVIERFVVPLWIVEYNIAEIGIVSRKRLFSSDQGHQLLFASGLKTSKYLFAGAQILRSRIDCALVFEKDEGNAGYAASDRLAHHYYCYKLQIGRNAADENNYFHEKIIMIEFFPDLAC
jgi:hypothetical protein